MNLLNQLEGILESDPLIDEIGFIHPSQMLQLYKEAGHSQTAVQDGAPNSGGVEHESTSFWNREHKLGISSEILFPLYKAAKHAFTSAMEQYKVSCSLSGKCLDKNMECPVSHCHPFESEVMNHSRALLLLSCDFGTAWNSRKMVVSRKPQLQLFMDELLLSSLVLSNSPKSEQAWSHRRWVIKMIAGKCSTLQEIIAKESELVEKIAERSKMNYRAWNHRCWLVSYMATDQVLLELKKSKEWAGLHVADNSCFHYRRRLIIKLLERLSYTQGICSIGNQVLKEELDWDEALIKRYIGREALWLHRRLLSLFWIRHLATDAIGISCHSEIKSRMDNELCLLDFCSKIQDSEFEDFRVQAMYSALYMLWLIKVIPKVLGAELRAKLMTTDLKNLLSQTCPERNFLWGLLGESKEKHLTDG